MQELKNYCFHEPFLRQPIDVSQLENKLQATKMTRKTFIPVYLILLHFIDVMLFTN